MSAKSRSRGNSINGKARKDKRRSESIARKQAYDKFSLKEKLFRLPDSGANRQRARYMRQLLAAEK